MSREDAIRSFNLEPDKENSLDCRRKFRSTHHQQLRTNGLDQIRQSGVQFIWQTGKFYINEAKEKVGQAENYPMLHTTDFITDMAAAYSAADFGHQPGRCRIYFRILSVRKACYLSSIAQCCRRSSDKECVGTGR